MRQNRALFSTLLLATLALAPSALAAETPQLDQPYSFQSVDSFLIRYGTMFEITGVLEGENTPRTLLFAPQLSMEGSHYFERCERMALLAMNKPGRYLFEVTQPESILTLPTCRLTRRQSPAAP